MKPSESTVFVTGGTGYIGSHCILDLLNRDYNVVTIDNKSNSKAGSIKQVEKIAGKKVTFYEADLCDIESIRKIFTEHKINFVIHFAACKNVSESIKSPLLYYKNNLKSSLNLFEVMEEKEVFDLVFSSSCSVYGDAKVFPLKEDDVIGNNITCSYGRTKYFTELILRDLSAADNRWNIISLRYFNPVGAHPSGQIGENNTKIFTNLMPLISQVAMKQREILTVFGGDYDTPDGTAIRDYIHVMDLVEGHVVALEKLQKEHVQFKPYNLGIGKGLSVLDLVKEFEKASGKEVPYKIIARREGDVARLVCDTSLAEKELGWVPKRNVEDMCKDFWKWQTMNPDGYAEL